MTRILIADDHKIMAEGLETLISNVPDFEVVGKACNGEEVLRFLRLNEVDLVIMDVSMPELDGLITTQKVKEIYGSKVKVLILTMHDMEGFIKEAIEAGTDGYILKNTGADEMIKAISEIVAGGTYFAQNVIQKITKKMSVVGETEGVELSDKEKKILPLLCDGLTPKLIGEQLNYSEHTIVTYKRSLFTKFEVHTVQELVKKAILKGYIRHFE